MSGTSTVPRVDDLAPERRGRWLRRAALLALLALVLAGLSGILGVHEATVSASSGSGLRARLTFANIARPALAVPFHLTIEQPGGFDGPIEVRITTGYLEAFDENGRNPEPTETTTDADETIWTFGRPDGDVLTVWLDTRVEPGVQWRRTGSTTVAIDGDEVVLDHTTWILP